MSELSLRDAEAIAAHALDDAASRATPISVAVVDRHGNLVFFARQDGSTVGSLESAQVKAYTTAAFGYDTADLFPLIQPGRPLFGLATAAGQGRHFTPLPGAVAIRDTVAGLLGAVGVGGAPSPDVDHQIARAAAASRRSVILTKGVGAQPD